MTPRLAASGPTRNPIARSLALAVLSLALAVAVVMGAVVFAALLGLFLVGYVASFVQASWRLARMRRRAAFVDRAEATPGGQVVEAEYEVVEAVEAVEAVGDVARRGPTGRT